MADQTILDQFVIKFKLDPTDAKKGGQEIREDTKKTTDEVKRSSQGMGSEITALAGKYLKLAAVIKGVLTIGEGMSSLSTDVRQLGIDARNLGIAIDELRDFQNVSEMMGGSAKSLTESIAGLQKSIFDLAYNGTVSDTLVTLGRLGVQFQKAGGGAREFRDIVLDTQRAIQGQMSNGMSREDANSFLMQAGFDLGTREAMLSGRAEELLAQQQQRRQVTGEHFKAAERWEQSGANRDQALAAGALGILPTWAKAGAEVNDALTRGINVASGQEDWLKAMRDVFGAANTGLNEAGDVLGRAGDKLMQAGDSLLGRAQRGLQGMTRGMRNNNPGNLKAVGDQRHDLDGFRIFDTMDEGILAADAQLSRYAARGVDTIDEIINEWSPEGRDNPHNENYKKMLENTIGVKRDRPLTEADRALLISGMGRFESGGGAPDSGAIADILQMQRMNEAPSINNTTNVDVGGVTIQTQATDARGIARDIHGELQRKSKAAYAERGQR